MPNIDDDIYTPAQAVGAANDNPDKAAQAVGLSAATGAPASTIYDDLDGFKTAVKQQTAAALVTANPQLAKFTNNPMAARVSNDDLDKLDAVSSTLTKAAQPGIWDRLKAVGDATAHGFDLQGQKDEFAQLYNFVDSPAWRSLVTMSSPGNPALVANMGMHAFQAGLEGGSEALSQVYGALGGQRAYEGIEKALTGRITGYGTPENLKEDVQTAAQVAFAPEGHLAPELNEAAIAAKRSVDVAKPFLDAGQPPPAGIDPHIDAAHVAQAQADLANLKEALAQSQESMTRGRAPSMYSEFVRQHVGDATIGINPQAVRELYGTEIPHFEDGKLGWVQDLPAQLLRSTVTGEDVHVPVADYLSKVDPAIHDALEPNIRTRPGGVTQLEAEALAQKAATVDMYHATDREYDELDPNASSRMAARSPFEEGTVFFGDSPEAVSGYGQRVLKAKIDLGNTATYDVRDLYNNDPSFIEKIVQAQHEENPGKEALAEQTVRDRYKQYQENKKYKYDAITREYNNMTPEDRALFEMPPIESLLVPDKIGNAAGARQAVMREARARGLDTVRIEGLTEGDQLAVLNPDKIQRVTEGDRVVGVVRRQAGLADASALVPESATGPMRQYPAPEDGSVEWRRSTPEGDEILVKREGGKDTYYNVGEAEGTAGVIDDLRKIVGPLPPLEQAAAEVAPHVLDHLGISDVPTYTVPGDHPAVKGALGMYYRNSDAIVLRHSASERQMLNTMVHESYHAAYAWAIDNVPGVKDAIQHLIDIGREAEGGGSKYTHEAGATDHYGLTNPHEFMSEGLSRENFQNYMSKVALTPEQTARFHELLGADTSKIKNLWDAFLQLARKTFGLADKPEMMTMLDAAFRVADRLTAAAEAERPQMAEGDFTQHALPQAPDPAFDHAAALGMTKGQLARYRELIAKQRGEEADARNAEILAEERKRQTVEWEKNKVDMRKTVSQELARRPDIQADAILRGGEKLDTDALTPEQQAAFKDSHTRGGTSPDELARQTGYETSDEMLDAVKQLRDQRQDARPIEYFRKMVEDETANRMEAQYGDLGRNVVEAAKDRVLSDTQTDLLFHDLEAAAGEKLPVSKAQMQANVAQAVSEMKLRDINSSSALTAAGRAAAKIEDSLLKGDAKAALAARFEHMNNILAAKEMTRIEKLKTQFAKTAKTYTAKPQVAGASQEYVNHIQDMLGRLGFPSKGRGATDIRAAMEGAGHETLAKFAEAKFNSRRDLNIPDFLLEDKAYKLGDLTGAQFEDTARALKSMVFNAREETKIVRAGERVDFLEARDALIEQLKSVLPNSKRASNRTRSDARKLLDSATWVNFNLETMLDRLDQHDPHGPFSQTLTRMFTEAAADEPRVIKEFQARLRDEVGSLGDLKKKVKNDLWRDPHPDANGELLDMDNEMRLSILQNVGNADNLGKLADGYKLTSDQVMQWVHANTTKEEWDRAQKIGDIFEELYQRADALSHRTSGVGLNKIPLTPIEHPEFGTYKGWYNPIAYDRILGKDVTQRVEDLDRPGFFRATTPQGYAKSRTRYIAPNELSFRMVPIRMKQMIHDITTREAVLQLSKFFYDEKFMSAVRDHYGMAQADEFRPFLQDFANSTNGSSPNFARLGKALDTLGSNFVGTMIGFNVNTVLKHGGTAFIKSMSQDPVGFGHELTKIIKEIPFGSPSWKFATENFDEVSRRSDNLKELIDGAGQDISLRRSGVATKMSDIRSVIQAAGGAPLAFFDKLSAVATANATYRRAIAEGMDEGTAKYLANKDVRATHGSSLMTNKPSVLRGGNPVARQFAKFYGFFSENLQQLYTASWMVKDGLGMVGQGEYGRGVKLLGTSALLAFTAGVLPAMVDYEVMKTAEEKSESWGRYLTKMMALSVGSSVLGMRDFVNALVEHRAPEGGPYNILKTFYDMGKDLVPDKHGKVAVANPAKVGKFIQESNNVLGVLFGITNAQVGRSARFGYDSVMGYQHPNSAWQNYIGYRFGSMKGHSRSYDEWVKQELPK